MNTQIATLAGGCFWCLEAVYDEVKGVQSVESGYAGGLIAARVLNGESPADIPIQSVVVPNIVLNLENAEYMGIEFPAEIIEIADTIIEKIN